MRKGRRQRIEHDLHLSGDQVGNRQSSAAIRYMNHVHAGHRLEKLATSHCHATTSVAASRKRPAAPENAFVG
jgi:hypothetical protein